MKFCSNVLFVIVLMGIIVTAIATVLTTRYNETDCVVLVSRQESRHVPYTETYKVRKWGFLRVQTRINYKTEYTTVWAVERRCCDRYEEINHVCTPICTNPCINGICVRPDTCECLPGYAKSSNLERRDYECEPECRTACTYGKCTEPDVCSCDQGYQLTSDNLHCIPICAEDCEKNNARCAMPDTCVCNSGYQFNETSVKCEPICLEPCVNGECVAPYVCNCTNGYEPDPNDSQKCIPKCDQGCVHGTCTAPNRCTCEDGYAPKNDNVCEPICSEPCVMGTCIAPETCSCDDGYGLLETSRYVCMPVCEKVCNNGDCSAPGVCTCHPGYTISYSDDEVHICHPTCKIPCQPFGVCIAPDQCTCLEGYRLMDWNQTGTQVTENVIPFDGTEKIQSACVPICNETCINGRCTAPDICSCNPGYNQSTNGSAYVCEPICEKSCGGNGTCTAPNVCTCDRGYELIDKETRYVCEPKCDVLCGENGTCTAPHVCTCDEGYANDEQGRCVPFCASSCQNGTCVAPNSCRCSDGFTAKNESVCVPFCDEGCQNGECIAPNECRCHEGFVFNVNDSTCFSTCTRNCSGHGVCADETKSCNCRFGWSGWDCEQPTFCILMMDFNGVNIDRVTVLNETNATLAEALDSAPYCYQCNDTLNNETLCYTKRSDDAVPAVGCFISTELPCYMMHRNNNSVGVSKLTGSLVVVTILAMACGATIAYFLFRRHRREKMQSVIVQTALFQETIANECLLGEEEVCLQ